MALIQAVTSSALLNSAGLFLDIVGASFLYVYGLPAEISRTGAVSLIAEQSDQDEIVKAAHYVRMGRVGLGLLIAGFFLQLVSNIVV